MPRKVYAPTEEHKQRISDAKKGIRSSPSTEFKKGNKVNLGRARPDMMGDKNPMHGKRTEEWCKQHSDRMSGEGNPNYGKNHSVETRMKMSEALKGKPSWAKGRTFSEEHRNRIGDALRGKYVGPNGANWRGGGSFEPYSLEWTPTLRRLIRERDGHCIFPRCEATTRLAVHHIDYDKMNCDPSNLITLCVGHNSKVNFDRELWEEYFNEIISQAAA